MLLLGRQQCIVILRLSINISTLHADSFESGPLPAVRTAYDKVIRLKSWATAFHAIGEIIGSERVACAGPIHR